MYAADPKAHKPPRSRKLCPFCEATPGGCRALHWLRGQTCCERCTGDHDAAEAS